MDSDIRYCLRLPTEALRGLRCSSYEEATSKLEEGEVLGALCEFMHTDTQSIGVTSLAIVQNEAQLRHLLCLVGDKEIYSLRLVTITSEQLQEATRK